MSEITENQKKKYHEKSNKMCRICGIHIYGYEEFEVIVTRRKTINLICKNCK